FGAPTKAGTEKCHGSALGADEIAGARKALGWSEAAFEIPADIRDVWRKAGKRSQGAHAAWTKKLAALDAGKRTEFERRMRGDIDADKLNEAVQAVKK